MKPLVYLAQPPLTQLNGPYPAVYYLRSFLEQRGCAVSVRDHSIALFEKIFCREGLKRVFADAGKARKRGGACTGADRRLRSIMERFFSEEDRWLAAINRLTAFLRGQDREWGHLLSLANGTLPGGPRFDACLAELCDAKGEAAPEDAPLLAGRTKTNHVKTKRT